MYNQPYYSDLSITESTNKDIKSFLYSCQEIISTPLI